jgi:hypothetical protein
MQPYFDQRNINIRLLKERYGDVDLPDYHRSTVAGVHNMNLRLQQSGGFAQ